MYFCLCFCSFLRFGYEKKDLVLYADSNLYHSFCSPKLKVEIKVSILIRTSLSLIFLDLSDSCVPDIFVPVLSQL